MKKLLSKYEWRKSLGNPVYSCYLNNKWAGIDIHKISHLRVFYFSGKIRRIKLDNPRYRIIFYPNCNVNIEWVLVEMETLVQAKKMAEVYHQELGRGNNEKTSK